jgi:Tetracyclin repressor-like, C-terminal domain
MSFYISPTGRIFSQFLAESQSDPEFAALFREHFLKPRRESAGAFLDRAMKQGVIDRTLNREILLDLIFGPMVFRLMAGHAPLNRAESDAMISTLLHGIRSKAPRLKRASGDKTVVSQV